jgi:hypothetical protein
MDPSNAIADRNYGKLVCQSVQSSSNLRSLEFNNNGSGLAAGCSSTALPSAIFRYGSNGG